MSHVSGVCRFCGCTPENPCLDTVPGLGLMSIGKIDLPSGLADAYACGWLNDEENLCTNPVCIEKAYREAADRVAQFGEA